MARTSTVLITCPHDALHGVLPYQLVCVHLTKYRYAKDWHRLPTGDILREVDGEWVCSGCYGVVKRALNLDKLVSAGKIECLCMLCVEALKIAAGFRADSAGNWVKP